MLFETGRKPTIIVTDFSSANIAKKTQQIKIMEEK